MKVNEIKAVYICKTFLDEENKLRSKKWESLIKYACDKNKIESLEDLKQISEELGLKHIFTTFDKNNIPVEVFNDDFLLLFIHNDTIYIINALNNLEGLITSIIFNLS